MLRVANRIIVVGSIILVLVLVVGGCVLEELQWQQMMHPDWPKQETAGAEVDRAVGGAGCSVGGRGLCGGVVSEVE